MRPEILPPIALPIHDRYNFRLPVTPVIRIEELIAEKLARFHRQSLARDLYDLFWFSTRVFDEPLVRQLTVLKVWSDIVLDRWSDPPFDSDHLLRDRRGAANYHLEGIGTLTVPVSIPVWEQCVRQRYAFVRALDQDQQMFARAILRDREAFDRAVEVIRSLH